MKKFLAAAVLLVLLAAAAGICAYGARSGGSKPSGGLPTLEWESIDAWPENVYTSSVPRPESGTPYSATVCDESAGYFSVAFHAAREQGDEYVALLRSSGFEPLEHADESGASAELLQNGDATVSVAVSDGGFCLMIRLCRA